MLKELNQAYTTPSEFVVTPDFETNSIINSRPKELLDLLFRSDPDSVFLLKGTGFSMDKQIQTWIDGYKSAITTGASLEENRRDFIEKTIQDVAGFYYEYLSGQDVFPIHVDLIEDENHEKKVYASKYKKDLKELTLPDERDGALLEGINKAIEIITESGPETLVILNSPSGWSGLTQDNQEIVYPDNQSYVYWIDKDGNLNGLTIRTDINLETSEKLVEVQGKEGSERERIKQVVRSPLSSHENKIEAALDLIESVSGRKFDKQRKELLNRDKLFNLNGRAKQIIENLRTFLTDNITHLSFENVKLFVKIVGKSILDLSREVLEPKIIQNDVVDRSVPLPYGSSYFDAIPPNYYELADAVKKIPGCNGGGMKSSSEFSNQTQSPEYYSMMTESMDRCQICGGPGTCGWCTLHWETIGKHRK